MNDREKLIEIVRNSLKKNIGKSCKLAENIVDDIIGAGVIVPPVKVGSSDRYTICAYCNGCADVMLREGISVGDAICQLADYENTGLSPAEIKALISEKEREDNG